MNDILAARKRKFLELKEKAGDAQKLMDNIAARPWRVYFDEHGTITCFTNNPNTPVDPSWRTHEFSNEQLQILRGKNLNKYRVHIHPLIDNKYSIEAVKEEPNPTALATDFLMLVAPSSSNTTDVCCELTEKFLCVSLSASIIDEYRDIDTDGDLGHSTNVLKFYLTAPNDPHIMLNKVHVPIRQLLQEHQVQVPLDDDYRQCSIYTKKVFKGYSRKDQE